jgi:hypothetical protein
LGRAILSVASDQLWAPPEVLHEFLCEIGHILRDPFLRHEYDFCATILDPDELTRLMLAT